MVWDEEMAHAISILRASISVVKRISASCIKPTTRTIRRKRRARAAAGGKTICAQGIKDIGGKRHDMRTLSMVLGPSVSIFAFTLSISI